MKVLQSQNNNRIAKIWVDDLTTVESQALDQIRLMLEHPALYKHIAVMPDTHLGKGAVVGGVVALDRAIVPNIVGVDIGCGMSAINTGIKRSEWMDKGFWMNWKSRVDREIPVGFNARKEALSWNGFDTDLYAKPLNQIKEEKAGVQLGTLGGGNHFLEAQVDEDDNIWFMVHSGSRHIGLQISKFYNNIAEQLNKKYFSRTPQDLWFLPMADNAFHEYYADLKWATDYALENRWIMLEGLYNAFLDTIRNDFSVDTLEHKNVREEGINIHHNFAQLENHFGDNVVVHRKGATQAKEGQVGIIPGSMGTNSYIVKGKGNEDSYMSCSHGAGRTMSRSQAKREFKSNQLQEALLGTYTKPSEKFIDEAPMAYKDIDLVMNNQKDLVEIVHTLKPIITVKG